MPSYHGRRISSAGLRTFSRSCSARIVGNPEAIALRYFAEYTQKWFSFDTSQKSLQRLLLGIDFRFSRAKGATLEALLFLIAAFCRRDQSLSC
jgi:hypothetical protein